MEGIIEQNTLSKPIKIKNLKRYLKKEDAICKLITGSGTGFFCKFTVNGRTMKGLFTNNHVLKEDLIKENSIIELKYNDEIKEIKITSNRFKCTNEELDYTCIEIFDNKDYNNYFEIDDNINCQNPNIQYGNKLGAIYQFPNEKDSSCGEGLIEGIKNVHDTNIIIHKITTDCGSSGTPIFLSDNLKVIGIHCKRKDKDTNEGIYFKNILRDIENK